MACDIYVTIKILELILSIACIVYKRVSDDEGRRLNVRQEKQNYEWPLLRYITWEQNGSSYADITYGSYVIITMGLLIGYLSGELAKGRNMESFLLGFGALLFIAVGSLELAALDSVPDELIDNAAILGVVSLLTGFLFLLDIGLSGKRRKRDNLKSKLKHSGPSKLTQTDEKIAAELLHKMNGLLTNGNSKSHDQIDKNDKVVGQLKSSLKGKKNDGESMHVTFPSDILNPPPEVPPPLDYPSNLNGGGSRDLDIHGVDSSSEGVRTSQKLRRADRIPKLPKPREESDGDDSLNIPTVAFIMRERSDLGSQSSLRAKSPSFRSKMLPMIPVETPRHEPDYTTPTPLNKALSQPELVQSTHPQKYESGTEEHRELVIMSPTEKNEFMEYKKLMKNLTSRSQDFPPPRSYGPGDFDAVLKTTYSTEEIVEAQPQISPSESSQSNKNQRSTKPKIKSKPERPKGYVEQEKLDESPRDFSEDISHMSPSERERYLFGESPKQKESTSASPVIDHMSSKKTSPAAQSTSPEADAHWRFDSRDANLVQSFRMNPRDSRESPSSPMDPGYVLHTASNWPQSTPHSTPKTPSQSPSDVAAGTSPKTPYRISSDESDTNTSNRNGTSKISREPYPYSQPLRMSSAPPPPPPQSHALEMLRRQESPRSPYRREYMMEDEDERTSPAGSLTTQLLQKWIKQRHTKVAKMRSDP